MPAIPNVIRRGATYHWRRRLPATFGESAGSVMLVLGLRTRDPSRARFLAGQVTALADLFLSEARTMRLTPEQTKRIFAQVFTAHLDKLEVISARERGEPDFNLEQERLADIEMGWVYRLLETRGEGASVDERAASQMEATGLDGTAISDVAVMLDLMRRNKLVPDRRTSLQTLVEDQGAHPRR